MSRDERLGARERRLVCQMLRDLFPGSWRARSQAAACWSYERVDGGEGRGEGAAGMAWAEEGGAGGRDAGWVVEALVGGSGCVDKGG